MAQHENREPGRDLVAVQSVTTNGNHPGHASRPGRSRDYGRQPCYQRNYQRMRQAEELPIELLEAIRARNPDPAFFCKK